MLNSKISKLSFLERKSILIFIDLNVLIFSIWFSFFLRISNPLSEYFLNSVWIIPVMCSLAIPIYILTGFYRGLITYTGSSFIYKSALSNIYIVLGTLTIGYLSGANMPPRSIWVIVYILIIGINSFIKIILRDFLRLFSNSNKKIQKVVIYGAGSAGAQLISSLRTTGAFKILFIVDDNKKLWKRNISGIKIKSPEFLKNINYKIDNVLLAIPSLNLQRRKQIIYKIQDYGFSILEVPSIDEITEGKSKIGNLRRINIEDLLQRDIVNPIPELLINSIQNSIVLITGAGGSIGSEIGLQLCKLNPKKLILIDSNEKNLYELINNLEKFNSKSNKIKFVLGNCCDKMFMDRLIKEDKVELIFHSSAYKHVNLVEKNPIQGLLNNILSSYVLCHLATLHKIDKVILISTDKAVRPTNIMGASKRVSELLFQAYNSYFEDTNFSIVRFGNVLNSSGSVIPLFRNQIKNGKPLTITHPKVIRYFMTIQEAAQLVIQSSSLSKGGEVFLLDMGEPVEILDLAKKMIKLSGLTIKDKKNKDGDIEIIFTGLKSGEKLYEELLIDNKSKPTIHPLIYKAEETFIPYLEILPLIKELENYLRKNDQSNSLKVLKKLVPEWKKSF
tara:strand:- start:12489 stop:14339 length:1851 start_codon:yes stop_codon:yes gene_type:complete